MSAELIIPDGYRRVWEPLRGSQERYLRCPYFECLLEGTRGGGKTDCLLMDFVQHVGLDDRTEEQKLAGWPQRRGFGAAWRGVIVRRTYNELRDLINRSQVMLYQMFGGAAKYNKVEKEWSFPWGEKLTFIYADSPDDYRHYHGWNLTFVGFEELTLYPTPAVYLKFMSLVRSTYPGIPKKYRATTNPSGAGHGWVKSRFQLPGNPSLREAIVEKVEVEWELGKKEMVTLERTSVRSDVRENYHLGDPKEYIAGLTANAENPAQLAAWVYGDWNVVAGGMFSDCWDTRCHVLAPFKVPHSWRIDRSYDWGLSSPFSYALWAESDGSDLLMPNGQTMSTVRGDLFRLREWYGWNGKANEGTGLMINEQSEGIVKREVDWGFQGRVRPGPADGQIFQTQGNTGVSFANDFLQPVRVYGHVYPGIPWLSADKSPGSVVQGTVQLRDRMKAVRQAYETGKPRERRGIYICSPCTQWLRTVPSLARDPDDLDRLEDGQEDHCYDETRYRVHNPPREVHTGKTRGT